VRADVLADVKNRKTSFLDAVLSGVLPCRATAA
jgi:hypothetical protein